MPRWAAKKDTTHGIVRAALKVTGWSFLDVSRAPYGVDFVIARREGWFVRWVLVEAKSRRGKLTPGQQLLWDTWPGETAILRSVDDVLALNRSGQDISPPQRGL